MLIAGGDRLTRETLRHELRGRGIVLDDAPIGSLHELGAYAAEQRPEALLVLVDSLREARWVLDALRRAPDPARPDVFFCSPGTIEEADAFSDRHGVGVVRAPIDVDRLALILETYIALALETTVGEPGPVEARQSESVSRGGAHP